MDPADHSCPMITMVPRREFRILKRLRRQSLRLSALLLLPVAVASAQQSEWPEYDSLSAKFSREDSIQQACDRALRFDSTDIDAWEGLCRLAKRQGKYEEAMNLALRAVELLPYSVRSHIILGDAYLDNGYVPEAVQTLRNGILLDTTSVRALTMLAEAYDLAEMSDSTLAYIDAALRLNPRNVQAHYQRADHLYRIGRRLEAIESYEAWATLQPFKAEPWVKLGEALTTVGLFEKAMEALTYAMSLDSASAEAAYYYAVSLHGAGRTREAREAFVNFLFTWPRHPLAADAEQMARALGWSPGG